MEVCPALSGSVWVLLLTSYTFKTMLVTTSYTVKYFLQLHRNFYGNRLAAGFLLRCNRKDYSALQIIITMAVIFLMVHDRSTFRYSKMVL